MVDSPIRSLSLSSMPMDQGPNTDDSGNGFMNTNDAGGTIINTGLGLDISEPRSFPHNAVASSSRRNSDSVPRKHHNTINTNKSSNSNSGNGKCKSSYSISGDTSLARIKQELDFLAQTEIEVAKLKHDLPTNDRKLRRKEQNRLAQRAFRARSKVHHQEVSGCLLFDCEC